MFVLLSLYRVVSGANVAQISLVYGIYYSFFEVFPLAYPKIYNMSSGAKRQQFLSAFL